jgi:hypothetical protein
MNNKAVWLIITIFTILLIGGVLLFLKLSFSSPLPVSDGTIPTPSGNQGGTGGNSTTVTPSQNGSQEQGIAVAAYGGNSILVKDFKKDPETKAYPDNSLYYLSGGLTPSGNTTPYSIYYAERNKSFSITLLQKPLGSIRKQAEQTLLKKLGLSEVQACNLVVYVGVPAEISEEYAGMELGLSFCPGSVALP